MNVKELFDFITDINIGIEDEKVEAELEKIQERLTLQQSNEALTDEQQEQLQKDIVDEEVFKRSFIPRKLDDVIDVERDVMKVAQGEGENLIYRKLTGLSIDDKKHQFNNTDNESQTIIVSKDIGKRNEDKDAKKVCISICERKKIAKEEAREKRKHKIPKAVKKRKIKTTSGKKTK
ncbi:42247_t:CDS:2 [Gigaspora margarita]|uniref:42247_t:CDS:1 n=1 Tax=Gigaspora margarita TaxID=4874 RepID=A0ABN7V6E7_GIGMA|nr:42247_t:CDS:2 [Gigaspora margarita]